MTEADASSSTPSHPLIESDHIEGTVVYDADGKQIGTIKRLVIEKVSGHVVYAVTSFGGFLGLGSETHTLPWEQLHYDTALHGYNSPLTKSLLRDHPTTYTWAFSFGHDMLWVDDRLRTSSTGCYASTTSAATTGARLSGQSWCRARFGPRHSRRKPPEPDARRSAQPPSR